MKRMDNVRSFIETGILETYVLGITSFEEAEEVEYMAANFAEVRDEIDSISVSLESYAFSQSVEPVETARPFIMAAVDYTERMKTGEIPTFPPKLHKGARLVDYSDWLQRYDMVSPPDFKNLYAKLIGVTPAVMTAIVWIKNMAPQEVHDNEFEKFLIVEGTCDIIIGEKLHQLVPGDMLEIPLHTYHHVKVTSPIPCKAILQRIAA